MTYRQQPKDEKLSTAQKKLLIKGIKLMQQERWKRLRFWHNADQLKMKDRHWFMRLEIDLIREQRERLRVLKESVAAVEN